MAVEDGKGEEPVQNRADRRGRGSNGIVSRRNGSGAETKIRMGGYQRAEGLRVQPSPTRAFGGARRTSAK